MSEYSKTTWVNGETPINANNLNKIENGILSNSREIQELLGGMRFSGVVTSVPANPEVGNVYQANAVIVVNVSGTDKACKVGDLLVYTSAGWHIIPSGDEANGTVRRISAGSGLTTGGAPIVDQGTISIDNTHINTLIDNKLNTLAPVATTGDFNSLINIRIDDGNNALRPFVNTLGEDQTAIVSQYAITTALNTKSDIGHIHEISEVTDLEPLLATDITGSELVKAAREDHEHGYISKNGYLRKQDGSGGTLSSKQYLITNSQGLIVSSSTIPSTDINGLSFHYSSNGTNINVDLGQWKEDKEELYNLLPKEKEEDSSGTIYYDVTPEEGQPQDTSVYYLVEIAARDHTHNLFSDNIGTTEGVQEYAPGFVSPLTDVLDTEKSQYLLCGDGQWRSISEDEEQSLSLVTEEKNEFIEFSTTAPSAPIFTPSETNPDEENPYEDQLRIIVLDAPLEEGEPYYDNYLYLIKG